MHNSEIVIMILYRVNLGLSTSPTIPSALLRVNIKLFLCFPSNCVSSYVFVEQINWSKPWSEVGGILDGLIANHLNWLPFWTEGLQTLCEEQDVNYVRL